MSHRTTFLDTLHDAASSRTAIGLVMGYRGRQASGADRPHLSLPSALLVEMDLGTHHLLSRDQA